MNHLRFSLILVALLSPCLPTQAQGRLPDPIAYSCYFCTDDEMEQVAIDQGVGEHYVYDANRGLPYFRDGEGMYGYTVSLQGGMIHAARFEPERWLKTQYAALMYVSQNQRGTPEHRISGVNLLAPDAPHGRSAVSSYLWGHHTSALHPLHARARQTLRRWIDANVDLEYMRADVEHGRVLQFAFQVGGLKPTLLQLTMSQSSRERIYFYMDRVTRQWEYLGAESAASIEESADDFPGPTGLRQFDLSHSNNDQSRMAGFLQRAQWAGVPVQGHFSERLWNYVDCTNVSGSPACTIKQTR